MNYSKHMYTGLTFANRQFEEVGVLSFILSAMHSCMNGSVHDQSGVCLYSGAERSSLAGVIRKARRHVH